MSDYWEEIKHWLGFHEYEGYSRTKDVKSVFNLPGVGNLHDVWNDYGKLAKARSMYAGLPYISDRIQARMDELEAEENERYWSDKERNTGMSRRDNPYPIRSGYYRYSGSSGLTFDVNYAIMALYNGSTRGLNKLRKRD